MWNTQKSHWIQEQPGSHPYFARECQPGKVPAVGGVGARCDSLPPSASTSTWETATTDAFLQIHFWRANVFWQILDQAENSKSAPFLTQRGGRYTATSLNPQNKGGTAVERENSRWVDEADRPTTGKKMQGYLTDTYIIAVYCGLCFCFNVLPNRFSSQYAPWSSSLQSSPLFQCPKKKIPSCPTVNASVHYRDI